MISKKFEKFLFKLVYLEHELNKWQIQQSFSLPWKKKKKNPSLFPSIFNTVLLIRFISKDGVELEKTLMGPFGLSLLLLKTEN